MTTQSTKITIPASSIDVGYFSNKFVVAKSFTPNGTLLNCRSFQSLSPLVPRTSNSHSPVIGQDELEGVVVEVDSLHYFVGPDAPLRGTGVDTRAVLNSYCETPEYKAQVKGALYYIAQEQLLAFPNVNTLHIGEPTLTAHPINSKPTNPLGSKSHRFRYQINAFE